MDDLTQAVRLLHVLRAWSWTPANLPDPAREDDLYPENYHDGERVGKGRLWQAVDAFLKDRPYQSAPSASGEPK